MRSLLFEGAPLTAKWLTMSAIASTTLAWMTLPTLTDGIANCLVAGL